MRKIVMLDDHLCMAFAGRPRAAETPAPKRAGRADTPTCTARGQQGCRPMRVSWSTRRASSARATASPSRIRRPWSTSRATLPACSRYVGRHARVVNTASSNRQNHKRTTHCGMGPTEIHPAWRCPAVRCFGADHWVRQPRRATPVPDRAIWHLPRVEGTSCRRAPRGYQAGCVGRVDPHTSCSIPLPLFFFRLGQRRGPQLANGARVLGEKLRRGHEHGGDRAPCHPVPPRGKAAPVDRRQASTKSSGRGLTIVCAL